MRPASASIAPEGFPLLVLLALCALCFAALDWGIATVVVLFFFFFTLHFFRDPERVIPHADGLRPTAESSRSKNVRIPLTAKNVPVFPYS